jgi:hypothetical protein
MPDKQQLLSDLRSEYDRWQALLAKLEEDQITIRRLPAALSIKDVVGHLHAWQQISITRLEAAHADREPIFPVWLGGLEPDADENLEHINATIHAAYLDRPWSTVHSAWQSGFLRTLELAAALPESDMFDSSRYSWLGGYTVADVLVGSYTHHQEEHYEPLVTWLRDHAWLTD